MHDQEIRWGALVPLSLLLGLGVLLAESFGVFGGFPARPEWFWCLAFTSVLRAPPTASIGAFAWCGFARDMLLGTRLGAASIAFVLTGWVALYWKPLVSVRGWPERAAATGVGGFACSLVRRALEAGWTDSRFWDRMFFVSLGDGLLTSLLFIPMALVLSWTPFRPWRERSAMFT